MAAENLERPPHPQHGDARGRHNQPSLLLSLLRRQMVAQQARPTAALETARILVLSAIRTRRSEASTGPVADPSARTRQSPSRQNTDANENAMQAHMRTRVATYRISTCATEEPLVNAARKPQRETQTVAMAMARQGTNRFDGVAWLQHQTILSCRLFIWGTR